MSTPNRLRSLPAHAARWAAFLFFRGPLSLVSWLGEAALSRRGLTLGWMALAALLAVSPWLRPPITRDLRATHIPIGVRRGAGMQPAALWRDRRWRWDSVGAPVLVIAALGAAWSLARPRDSHAFTGAILALSLAGTADLLLNHPALIDALDHEFYQRNEIRRLMSHYEDFSLSGKSFSRIDLRRQLQGVVPISTETDAVEHGWYYLAWSPWLITASAFVLLASVRGSWSRRFQSLAVWTAVGVGLSMGVGYRRILAEWHWARCARFEARNALDSADDALNQVLRWMPEFRDIERTLLTKGRIDYRRGVLTIESEVFLAEQVRSKRGDEKIYQQAIPNGGAARSVRNLVASNYYAAGRRAFLEDSAAGAETFWRRGYEIAPWRIDCRLAHAIAIEQQERTTPETVESLLYPHLPAIGDRLIRADMQSLVGDAYFEAGRPNEARTHYQASMKTFTLPRFINPHAQEAMLGM